MAIKIISLFLEELKFPKYNELLLFQLEQQLKYGIMILLSYF